MSEWQAASAACLPCVHLNVSFQELLPLNCHQPAESGPAPQTPQFIENNNPPPLAGGWSPVPAVCDPTQHSDSGPLDLIVPSVRQWILLVSVGTMKAMSAKTLISCSKQSLKLICRHNNFFCAKFHEGNHLCYGNGCENNESVVSGVPGAGQWTPPGHLCPLTRVMSAEAGPRLLWGTSRISMTVDIT